MSTTTQTAQYLTFQLAADRFAIPTLRVHGILRSMPVTPVPGSAPFVKGVFNNAGAITPVVDLGVRLGLGETAMTRRTCFILVGAAYENEELPIGLVVDSVNNVADIDSADIQPPPVFGTRIRLDYLDGLVRSDDGFTMLLSVDRFLTADELLAVASSKTSFEG